MATEDVIPAGRVLLVGLGNPGAKYDGTRHNIGFALVREVARRYVEVRDKKFKGRFGQGDVRGPWCRSAPGLMGLGEAVQPCAILQAG